MIDHATPLSASAIITSKKPRIIISKIFQLWISVYGLLKKFLSDKGREFANDQLHQHVQINEATFQIKKHWITL